MEIQLIRNATLRLNYGGVLFLIDPYLADKFTLSSYADVSPNPLVDLPISAAEVLEGIECVIISHLHTDHFDAAAQEALHQLDPAIPILCQPSDQEYIEKLGFTNVMPIYESTKWQGVSISRTAGQHGSGETAELMGKVSGFMFRASSEPTLYWAGDTILYEAVTNILLDEKPQVVVTHSCGARWKGSDPIVMDAEQTLAVCMAVPDSTIVATHMEALDHATISREDLQTAAEAANVSNLKIPADGETVELNK